MSLCDEGVFDPDRYAGERTQRAARGTELGNGNRERWRNLFARDKEESIIVWAWQTHARNRAKFAAALADQENVKLHFVRLKNPAEVRRFLSSVSGGD